MRTQLIHVPQKYRRHMLGAETGRDLFADSLDEIRNMAEISYAQADAAWQESPDGRRYQATLSEILDTVAVIRRMTLPDVSVLK